MIDTQVADLYWAMRRVVRRYRAAKDKFGPKRKFKGGRFKRRFRRFGQKGGKAREGSFTGQIFISLDDTQ